MDARILSEADLQKLVHCEILSVEQSVVDGTVCITFGLRSFDETVFQLAFMPGIQVAHLGGQAIYKPGLNIITTETIPAGGS